eukprot:CAMPEP_0179963822 /NCGR_PEP_ID=MMETSP0983-20121128/30983_1 /TAXON_ID=483367 /ORGANISM="non described non described, Strain CCMP 2436" /LENGTH=228 /DNA_ID=CAMNT_0021876473 /DNA_START=433 /DNA_END=1116 /DNA_ORIENTATION=-
MAKTVIVITVKSETGDLTNDPPPHTPSSPPSHTHSPYPVEIASSSSLPREQSALPIGGTSATRRLLLDRLAFSAPSVRSSVSDCLASSSHRQQQAAPTQGTPAQAVGCGGSGFESKIREVSQVVALVLADLAAAAGGDAPLVIVAHGLGAVVVATFLRDVQALAAAARLNGEAEGKEAGNGGMLHSSVSGGSQLELAQTLCGVWTIGCPIAPWLGARLASQFGDESSG